MKIITLIVFVLTMAGCANSNTLDYVVDGRSDATTNQTLANIQSTLSSSERQKLMLALIAIKLDGVNGSDYLANGSEGNNIKNLSGIGAKIDGSNYTQIIELAEKSSTNVSLDEG